MLNKKSIIGICFGILISVIGIYALVQSLEKQTINIDDTVKTTEFTRYKFNAPVGAHEVLTITGADFYIELEQSDVSQILRENFKNTANLDWVVKNQNTNTIMIKNTGYSDLYITGIIELSTDPVLYTLHILVIISGIVIIGFSSSFGTKKK